MVAALSPPRGLMTLEPKSSGPIHRSFAARLRLDGHHHRISESSGSSQQFAGFVHTFYPLVPPAKYFAAHPEWYSEIRGKRTAEVYARCACLGHVGHRRGDRRIAIVWRWQNGRIANCG